MQKITPFLWFGHQAEQAMNTYTSVFKNAKVGQISRYGEAGRDGHASRLPPGRAGVHGDGLIAGAFLHLQ
jgi:predicted 3-demethylubiquinone-9 3-methyltransferase (glyoxalase superfamily)